MLNHRSSASATTCLGLPPGEPRDVPPPAIPGYEIRGRLGSGGMGTVYDAVQIALNRPVALKVLDCRGVKDPTWRERFLREARLAASVDHPNLVPVYDAGQAGPFVYIAMRRVPGGDLARRLAHDGPLPLSALKRLADDCARGLAMLAAHGIVHRDMKPANILLETDGTARLADFGLAMRLDDDRSITVGTPIMGTPQHLSPEQALGQPLDHRADLYGLGSVLYTAATGTPPFVGPTAYATIAHMLKEPATTPSQRRPKIPVEWDQVLMRLLAKDRNDRYQHANDLLADLAALDRATTRTQRLHLKPPAIAPPPGNTSAPLLSVEMITWRLTCALGFLLVLIAGVWVSPPLAPTARRRTRRLIYPPAVGQIQETACTLVQTSILLAALRRTGEMPWQSTERWTPMPVDTASTDVHQALTPHPRPPNNAGCDGRLMP